MNVVAHLVLAFCGLVAIGAFVWGVFPAATEWYAERLFDRVYGVVFYRRLRAERLAARRRLSLLREREYCRGRGPTLFDGAIATMVSDGAVFDLDTLRVIREKLLEPYRPDEAA